MWHHNSDKKFEIPEPGRHFLEDQFTLPVETFINDVTGEVKFFATKAANQIGIANIIKMLNNEEERKYNAT